MRAMSGVPLIPVIERDKLPVAKDFVLAFEHVFVHQLVIRQGFVADALQLFQRFKVLWLNIDNFDVI